MNTPDTPIWRKSSRSDSSGGTQCVELAELGPEIGIRDSKNPEAGHHTVSNQAFRRFLAEVRRGDYDL